LPDGQHHIVFVMHGPIPPSPLGPPVRRRAP
jgi:hypothetical protein